MRVVIMEIILFVVTFVCIFGLLGRIEKLEDKVRQYESGSK